MPVWASAKNFWQILCNLQKLIDTIVNNAKCVTIGDNHGKNDNT